MSKNTGKKFLSDLKLYSDYLKWKPELGRYETWDEAVSEIVDGHRQKFSKIDLEEELQSALESMKEMKVFASQRNLQFRYPQVKKNNAKIYNCTTTYMCRTNAFQDVAFLSLSGCGVGISLLRPFVNNLPDIKTRTLGTKTFVIPDTIEGWADSVGVLMSSYFVSDQTFPEYAGYEIKFDYSLIRDQGAYISGGFKAPGPDGLKASLEKIEKLIENWIKSNGNKVRPILAFDILCHIADFVISGGVRRCLPGNDGVLTSRGIVKLKDIEIGDEVLTHTGSYKPVIEKVNNGKRKLLKIITNCGHYYSTPEHEWATAKNINGEINWKLAKDLRVGDTFILNNIFIEGGKSNLPNSEDFEVPELDTNIAWFVGYFLGNGNCGSGIKKIKEGKIGNYSSMCVTFPIDYPELEPRIIREFLKFSEKYTYEVGCRYKRIMTGKKKIAKYFLENFKQPNSVIKIPKCILESSHENRLAFLSGILDSDGSVRYQTNKEKIGSGQIMIVSTKYYEFAREIQGLISSLGIPSKLSIDQELNEEKNTEYKVKTIDSTFRNRLVSMMLPYSTKLKCDYAFSYPEREYCGLSYNPKLIDWKTQRNILNSNGYCSYSKTFIKNGIGSGFIPANIISIEESSEQEVFDIEVLEDNSFYINGALTHNSALSMIVDPNDEEMINAKTGNWRQDNPQRARSNNSVLIPRTSDDRTFFDRIVSMNDGSSDIGFVFCNTWLDIFNPCLQSSSKILTENGYIEISDLDDGKIHNFINAAGQIVEGRVTLTGYKPLITLVSSDGRTLSCTEDHVFIDNKGDEIQAHNCLHQHLMSYDKDAQSFYVKDIIENEGIFPVYDFSLNDLTHLGVVENVITHNCFEIILIPVNTNEDISQIKYKDLEDWTRKNIGLFGVNFCNLTEINGEKCTTKESFLKACKDGAILGTLQASYASFPYLGTTSEDICKREALLGVSITGIMNNPKLLDPKLLQEGCKVVRDTNEKLAEKIGINKAARCSTIKPSGNLSTIAQTASGIHPEHSERYFRIMQLNKGSDTAKWLEVNMPFLLEESVWSATKSDYVVYSPIINPKEGIFKKDMKGVKHLEAIKLVQENWVLPGTRRDRGICKLSNNNVSATVIVDNKEDIVNYIWGNRMAFTAVSFISDYGDKDFNQAPFTSVMTHEEILNAYGKGSLLASGLIIDGLHYFNQNLWQACDCVKDKTISVGGTREEALLRKSWIDRAKKFARNYFRGDLTQMVYSLKDVYLFHKWETISRQMKDVDFSKILTKPEYKEVGEYASIACSGNSCTISRI